MGRAAIREQVTTYLTNLSLPLVGTVHSARTYISEADYEVNMLNDATTYVANENGSAAVLVVNLPNSIRQRRADTGRGAVNDTYIHNVAIEVFFASLGGDPIAAQDDHDAIMDEMVVAIRADPNLGNTSVVWSAGEFDYGIRATQSAPFTTDDGTTLFITGLVEAQVYEWISGEVPR